MTLELESHRSSSSPVLMHAPFDTPGISARLRQPHEAQIKRAGDRRNVCISTEQRSTHSKDEARSRHTSAGASSSRLDTDVAVPASIGGQAATRLSLRSESAPADGTSTPSTSELFERLDNRANDAAPVPVPAFLFLAGLRDACGGNFSRPANSNTSPAIRRARSS